MLGSKKNERPDRTGLTRTMQGEASMSLIGPGMNIIGDLVTDGTVRVEGRIEGTIRAGKTVIVGKGGEVVGDVFTQDAVIGGSVRGTVVAESRLELQATCDIDGQIRTRAQHLQLEEGARFNGQVQMLDGSESLALPRPPGDEKSTLD
jgi:cytoskeletal protein CcmA (bactofilin family)